jgi:hypothetical protein
MLVDAIEERLEALDRIDESVIVLCPLFADERPPRRLAALVDWRSGGALSQAMRANDDLAQLGVVTPFVHPRLGGARVLTVGHGASLDEAGLRVVTARIDDALGTCEAKPYRVFAQWPPRLPHLDPLAEVWLAPLLAHLGSSRLCVVGDAVILEPVHRLLLRAERRLVGKSEPFSFPTSFVTESS